MTSSSFLIIMTAIFLIAGVGILLLLVVKNHSSIAWQGSIIDPSTLKQILAKVTKQNKQPAMGFAVVNLLQRTSILGTNRTSVHPWDMAGLFLKFMVLLPVWQKGREAPFML